MILRAELLRVTSDYVLLAAVAFVAFMAAVTPYAAVVPQVVMASAMYGAVRFCVDHRAGTVARTILLGHRGPALRAKVVSSVAGGFLVGLVAGVIGGPVADCVLAGTLAAPWGLFFGVIVRNYFVAPMVVLTVHMGSALVLESWPKIGELLPLGAAMSTVSPQLGVAVQLVWLLVAGLIAWTVMTLRDVCL